MRPIDRPIHPIPIKEFQLHRSNWRSAARIATAALTATAVYGASTAIAQTGAPAQATTPAATTPPTEVAITGKPITPNGTEGLPAPGNNECFVRLFKPKADNVPEVIKADDEIAVQYRLRCSTPISAFSISFNRDVTFIEGEVPVTFLSGNGITKDQAFSCGGETPGAGIACIGTYKGGYNTVRGLVSLPLTEDEVADKTSFCKLGLAATASVFTSEVLRDSFTGAVKKNADGTSQIANYAAGPYRLTLPQCHKGAKKASGARR